MVSQPLVLSRRKGKRQKKETYTFAMMLKTRPVAKGIFLISEPFMFDPHFNRSVVFIVEHNEEGTVGFVLNQPLDLHLNEVINGFSIGNSRLYYGGPCETNTLHYLHSAGGRLPGSLEIKNGIFWGGDPEALRQGVLAGILKPEEFRFFGGYSGWAPGQLDGEIKAGAWIVSDVDPGIVFRISPDQLWKNILKTMGPPFALLADAPADPSYN